ncbi:MAG: helix-turn-helix domain-containing protein [Candidatus Thorarchaeota archaeon]
MTENAVVEYMPVLKANLGLTDLEAKVMLPIYLGGNMTPGAVAMISGEKLPRVNRTLVRLENKGFVVKVEGVVPIFRPVPAVLSMTGELNSVVENIEGLAHASLSVLENQVQQTEQSAAEIRGTQSTENERTRTILENYENKMLQTVQSQVEIVVDTATKVLTGYSQIIEDALTGLDTTLDESLGAKLTILQAELDKSQIQLKRDLKVISREFDKGVKQERAPSLVALSDFDKKVQAIIKKSKKAVTTALTDSEKAIQSVSLDVSQRTSSQVLGTIDKALVNLGSSADSLTTSFEQLDKDLSQASRVAHDSLTSLISQTRLMSNEQADLTRASILDAFKVTESGTDTIDSWKTDVKGIMDVASQSMTAQFEQVALTERNYLDANKNTLVAYLDKIRTVVGEEYSTLQSLAVAIDSEFAKHLDDTKISMMGLFRSELETDETNLEVTTEKLREDLNRWSAKTGRSIGRKTSKASKEVVEVLDGKLAEVDTMTDKMFNEVKSSLGAVTSSAGTQSETILTGINKSAHEFEKGIDAQLGSVTTRFSSTADKYVTGAGVLYENLNARFDDRVSQSIKSLSSSVEHARQEIDTMMEDQMGRIDFHASEIRKEFHMQVEDISRQFINMTQGLEAAFGGLVASQIVETRDFIASTHTEFNAALNAEMNTLRDESEKLQVGYSSEMTQRIENLRDSASTMRITLEELAKEKKQDMSSSIGGTLTQLENATNEIQESLERLETDTTKEIADDLAEFSEEFREALTTAKTNLTGQLSNLSDATTTDLDRGTKLVRDIADSYFTEHIDFHQRLIASTSKKLDSLSTAMTTGSSRKVEAFQANLAKSEKTGLRGRNAVKTEIAEAIESHRTEASQAFEGAATRIDSGLSNITDSITILGDSLNNDLMAAQQQITRAANSAAKTLAETNRENLEVLEETGVSLFQKAEDTFREHAKTFGNTSTAALKQGEESLTDLPEVISDIVDGCLKQAVSDASNDFSKVTGNLTGSFSECERSAESAATEFKEFVDRVSMNVTKVRDSAFENAQQSVVLANQHASRKFESIGLDLRAGFSTESHGLIETVRNDSVAKTLQVANVGTKATNTAEETTAAVSQSRGAAFNKLATSTDTTLTRWVNNEKKQATSLHKQVEETATSLTESVKKTVETMEAVRKAGEGLLKVSAEKTWYLTGVDETCAYVMDMVQRAEESVVVSILNVDCLDLKKLSRIKAPKRRVLIVPEADEPEAALGDLHGWRIWYTKTPMLFAVADDSEIFLGGAEESDFPLGVVSTDEAYLRLYHDVIGPRLIRSRVQ